MESRNDHCLAAPQSEPWNYLASCERPSAEAVGGRLCLVERVSDDEEAEYRPPRSLGVGLHALQTVCGHRLFDDQLRYVAGEFTVRRFDFCVN